MCDRETSCAVAQTRNRLDGSASFKSKREAGRVGWGAQTILLAVIRKSLFCSRKTAYSPAACFIYMWQTCPCPRETATYSAYITENTSLKALLYSSLHSSLAFSDFICFYNLPCSLPYSCLLNPPSSIKFVFIPPACLPPRLQVPKEASKAQSRR